MVRHPLRALTNIEIPLVRQHEVPREVPLGHQQLTAVGARAVDRCPIQGLELLLADQVRLGAHWFFPSVGGLAPLWCASTWSKAIH